PVAGGNSAAAPAAPARLVPKARRMSTYSLRIRFEVATKDVSFTAPPDYQESFAFWTGKMKGQKRSELFEFVTLTQEARQDGSVPFRRTLPRFNMDLEKGGVPFQPYGPLQGQVQTMEWEGLLDPLGRVREIKVITDADNEEAKLLAWAQVDHAFPILEGPTEVAQGGSFTETLSLPMPQRLNVLGLEEIRHRVERRYTLRARGGDLASFEVQVVYALDPATPAQAPGTTCTITGGGAGEAVFNLRRGVFVNTRLPTTMRIDIEAPLRRLPHQPEGSDPGKATTRIDLDLMLIGNLDVKRLWGEEDD
ncbi:MAG: hypothetical protein ACRD5D_10055, partial [Candidatus Polarisedimenticolia bacterium]